MVTRGKATETELAYAAGVIDSDGWIGISKNARPSGTYRYTTHISVVNTSMALMNWLEERFGGNIINQPRVSENHKTTYYWRSSDDSAMEVLRQVRPYLVIKTMQADIAIKFREDWKGFRGAVIPADVSTYREEMFQLMRRTVGDRRHPQRLSEEAPGNGEAIVRSAMKVAEVSRND